MKSLIIFFILTQVILINAWPQNTSKDWELNPFEKIDSANPIMGPDTTTKAYCPVRQQVLKWEAKDVFNPCAVVKDDKVFLFYRAEDFEGKYKGTSRIGLAVNQDGIHFECHGAPVLYPENDEFKDIEWEGGCEDPRIVEDENGTYFMTYTAYSGKSIYLCIASSTDLLNWTKHGVVAGIGTIFPGGGGYKAGMIISELKDNRLIAKKINDKYWMYWGVGTLGMATSEDLIHWERVKDKEGNDLKVLSPRNDDKCKYTDNLAVEAGPTAVVTQQDIVVIYNGIYNPLPPEERIKTPAGPNKGNGWAGVQALYDKNDPTKLLARADKPFIKPDRPYEKKGRYRM